MTTTQKLIIGLGAALLVSAIIYQGVELSRARREIQALRPHEQEVATLKSELQTVELQREDAVKKLAATTANAQIQSPSTSTNPNEVLRLRGEVGRLRREKSELASSSPVSKVTSDPATRKLLRDQQKMGMGMIYKGFAERAKLDEEQTGKLNDLLADHIMDNVDRVATALRDKPAPEEMDRMFSAQEKALETEIESQFGAEALAQYKEYTHDLASILTTEQFKGMLTGSKEEKDAKSKQLLAAMQQEVQTALASNGLPADYQVVPILNFRNIASESQGDKSMQLLESIYDKVATRSSAFLTPEEITAFEKFRKSAIQNNRTALAVNRTMMAPLSQ